MITAAIIDDNKFNRKALRELVNEYCPDIELIFECSNAADSEGQLLKHKPDLVFLDVDLGDGTAFELLQKASYPELNIIFVTAHADFAIHAFKHNTIDYLLKPIQISELIKAVDRVKSKLMGDGKPDKSFITVNALDRITILHVDEIIRIESQGPYSLVICETQNVISTRGIGDFEKSLFRHSFLRIHHSHLVNIKFINTFNKRDMSIILKNGEELPVSFRRKNDLLGILSGNTK